MWKIRGLIFLGVWVLLTVDAYTEETFREEFFNSGADAGISKVNWHVNYSSSGTAFNENNTDINIGPIVSFADFLSYNGFAVNQPILIWTDKDSEIGRAGSITNVSFSLYNQNSSINFKVALRVDSNWYVSQEVFDSTGSWTDLNLGVKAASWNSLTFISGAELSEGGSADLPSSGTVTAVGLFDAVGGPSGYSGRVRLDNYKVDLDPRILRLVVISN